MRWQVLVEDGGTPGQGETWAWDVEANEFFLFEIAAQGATKRQIDDIQQLSKFVPNLELVKEQEKEPDWILREPTYPVDSGGMPLPYDGEMKDDFVGRFMMDSTAIDKIPDEEERLVAMEINWGAGT